MHECPECSQVCYCDPDDANDCRDDGECFHSCGPEAADDFNDEPDACNCAACRGETDDAPASVGGGKAEP
jgi:hypothetical protein